MQPYRLALATCLDPPIHACPPPPPRKWRFRALAAGVLVVASSLGVYAGRAFSHRGHVEIAPSALTLARAHVRKPHARHTRQVPAALPPIADQAFIHGPYDPKASAAYAKKLASVGVDLTIIDVTMSPKAPEGQTPLLDVLTPLSWVVRYNAAHDLAAFEISRIPPSSPIASIGLAPGDRIVGIDGWTFTRDQTNPLGAHVASTSTLEVVRNERHIVFFIHWRMAL